jgi:putative peptidoglycan lipid II flippase
MVGRIIKFVYSEIRGLHQAAYLLAIFAFGSQLLAIARDRALAHTFGAGGELDLYYSAFRLPDLLFVLFASALSVYVLLPFVNRAVATGGAASGRAILGQLFTLFLLGYILVAASLYAAAPLLVPIMFPGLAAEGETIVTLTRILLLQPLLLGLSTLCGVITQMQHRFVIYALSPLLYNLGIIAGVLFFYPWLGLSGLAWGAVIGALGHFLVQFPLVRRSEFSLSLTRTFDWPLVRTILLTAIPRALTLSIHQIVIIVLTGAATLMTAGSVAVFQFAFNLQSVPLVIIGMSYSVAAFPTLAGLLAQKKSVVFNEHLLTAMRHIIFWSLPIIALIIVLRAQIVRVLLGSGAFDWADTRLTAAALAVFVISLAAQALLLLLIRAFYAASRTQLPLLIASFGAVVSIVSAFALTHLFLSHEGFRAAVEGALRISDVPGAEILMLAFGFALGTIVEACVLLVIAARSFGLSLSSLSRPLLEAALAAMAGGAAAYATLNFVVEGIAQDRFLGVFLQGAVAGIIGLIFIIITYGIFRSRELKEVSASLHTKFFRSERDRIPPQHDAL